MVMKTKWADIVYNGDLSTWSDSSNTDDLKYCEVFTRGWHNFGGSFFVSTIRFKVTQHP